MKRGHWLVVDCDMVWAADIDGCTVCDTVISGHTHTSIVSSPQGVRSKGWDCCSVNYGL